MNLTVLKKDAVKVIEEAKANLERELEYRVNGVKRKLDEMQADVLKAIEAAEDASKINVASFLDGKHIYKSSLKIAGSGINSYCAEARESFLKLSRVPAGDYDALVILTPVKASNKSTK